MNRARAWELVLVTCSAEDSYVQGLETMTSMSFRHVECVLTPELREVSFA